MHVVDSCVFCFNILPVGMPKSEAQFSTKWSPDDYTRRFWKTRQVGARCNKWCLTNQFPSEVQSPALINSVASHVCFSKKKKKTYHKIIYNKTRT